MGEIPREPASHQSWKVTLNLRGKHRVATIILGTLLDKVGSITKQLVPHSATRVMETVSAMPMNDQDGEGISSREVTQRDMQIRYADGNGRKANKK